MASAKSDSESVDDVDLGRSASLINADPIPSNRAHLLLLQIIVTIVLSYQVVFGEQTFLLYQMKEYVVLGLMVLLAGLMSLPKWVWDTNWFPGLLAVSDTVITSGTIYLSGNAESGLYLTYFLIILIAAALPSLKQVIGFSIVLCVAYGVILYLGPGQLKALSENELLRLPVLLIMATFYGVTADTVRRVRRRAERQLRESEVKFRSVIQSAQDAIIVADGQGTILSWNRAARAIFGYEDQEAFGRSLCLLMPERYREAHLMGLRRFLATGESYIMGQTVEFPGLRKDGAEFPAEISLATWDTEDGRYFSGILRDISERKQVEAFISRKEERLQHSQKMDVLGRFAAEVAHDFNHLLFVIMGSAQLILKQMAPENPSVNKLTEIQKAVERGQALTQRLLNYSHSQPTQRRRVSLNAVIVELTPLLERLVGKNIHIVTNLFAGLGDVEADARQIEQVLMNLVINARDAMPHGGTLTLQTTSVEGAVGEREKAAKPGSYARLAVSDTGIGMAPEVQARCFTPFFTTKEAGQGTGLGLSIVQSIVQQSGGVVGVQSRRGEGTTFLIDLPLIDSASAKEISAPKPARQGPRTVLVVDDSLDSRALTKTFLRQDGYTVLEAPSGEAALTLAANHPEPIDLLVTDIMMPEMNGRELALRLISQRPDMKVLYTSALGEQAMATYGVAGPEMIFLQKPFLPEALSAKVQLLLQEP